MPSQNYKLDADDVMAQASGRCLEIICALAPQLSEACSKPGESVKCPCHGSKDGFRLFKNANETGAGVCQLGDPFGNIFKLLQWANTWSFYEALSAVANHLVLNYGGNNPRMTAKLGTKVENKKDWDKEKKRLKQIWDEAIPDNGRIAEHFKDRGIDSTVPPSLKLHPKLFYYREAPKGAPKTYYPAMVAQLQLDGKCVGLHITYLDPNGSGLAPCSSPRKIRRCDEHKYFGASIHLYPAIPGEPLFSGEGIESCVAAYKLTGFPIWAAANSGLLENIELPTTSNPIFIAADLDKSKTGTRAANKLAERLHSIGLEVYIAYPADLIPEGEKSFDWNDYLNIEKG